MEQGSNNTPVERDFLDLRLSLGELAAGGYTLTAAILTSLFACSLLAVLYVQSAALAPLGLALWGLVFVLALCSALGLWVLFGMGKKKGALARAGLRLSRVFPVAQAVFCAVLCVFMAALLIVALFSNSMLTTMVQQAARAVEGSFFAYTAHVLATVAGLTLDLVVTFIVLMALAVLLFSLRVFALCRFQKKLLRMEESDKPEKSAASLTAFLSCLCGLLLLVCGGFAVRKNPVGGVSLLLFGLSMVSGGLLVHKAGSELRFLYTYYAKLNRAVQRRAEAIRAQTEAMMNAPLAIPAPDEAGETLPDIPSAADAPDVIVPPVPDAPDEDRPDVLAEEAAAAKAPEEEAAGTEAEEDGGEAPAETDGAEAVQEEPAEEEATEEEPAEEEASQEEADEEEAPQEEADEEAYAGEEEQAEEEAPAAAEQAEADKGLPV